MNRRLQIALIALLTALWAAQVLTTPLLAAEAPLVRAVDAVAVTVADMERSVDFFTKVLTFERVSDVEVAGSDYEHLQGVFGVRIRVVRLRLGAEQIELHEYLVPKGRPVPVDARSNDKAFQHVAIIVSDMAKAYARLREFKVAHASTGPQKLPEYITAAAGIEAFYFKDPDGHALEVLAFPPDKGEPRWHAKDKLFLGIDHTAIVVSDTERSLRFYRDLLGLAVKGESENHGPEQEHLNNVFGARLRISGLRAAAGPGIEFLEYLAPRDGRPAPADVKANDLFHWQTVLAARDAGPSFAAVRDAGGLFVSPGAVALKDRALGFGRAALLRDPDGHGVELVEK
ncbi:MAG TPA: VOC family protein [Vicinamibacteria bacterium]|nr:VOC family protein [Vicinamibacteria bacterium]